MFYFATANLLLRYACASFPVFAALGLSEAAEAFLEDAVGLASSASGGVLYWRVLGPSAFLVAAHAHRVGAFRFSGRAFFDGRSRNGRASGSDAIGRFAIAHAAKPLIGFGAAFACLNANFAGALVMAAAARLAVAAKAPGVSEAEKLASALPAEAVGAALAAAALAEYAFTIEWIRTRASDSVELCRWIGVLGLDASSR